MSEKPKALESDFHARIMNLSAAPAKVNGINYKLAYKEGHRDARHAAAEIANEADAEIEALRKERDALRTSIRTQRAVIDDQQTELDRKSDAIQRLWAERDELRKEVERLKADAERYRWLRDSARIGFELEDNEPVVSAVFVTPAKSLHDFDAAIDAAREAQK